MLVDKLKLNRKQTCNLMNLNYRINRKSKTNKNYTNNDPLYRFIYKELSSYRDDLNRDGIKESYTEEDFLKLNYLFNGTNPFRNEIDYNSSTQLLEFIDKFTKDLNYFKTNIKVSYLFDDPMYNDILELYDNAIESRFNMDKDYIKNEELLMNKTCDIIDYMINNDIDRTHNVFKEYFVFYLIKAYFSTGNIGCTISYPSISNYYNLNSLITCRDIGNILNASFKNLFETRLITSFANEINSYDRIKNK